MIAYDEAIENCLDISRQLAEGGIAHKIFNVSSIPNQNENWESTEDRRYYGHFFSAIQDFLTTDLEVFIFNAGDIQYDKYADYTSRIEALYQENPDLFVFAPDFTNSPYSGWGSYIAASVKYPEMYLSTNTDGLYVSMRRETAEYMNSFYEWCLDTGEVDFSTMRSGWGLDHSYCSLAIYLDKVIYRDSSVVMFHPLSTSSSYAYEVGVEEFYVTMRAFLKFAEQALGLDAERLKEITNITLSKIKDTHLSALSVEAIYANPVKILNA